MRRFFKAVLSLQEQFLYWPNSTEKKFIINENEHPYHFPNCLGFIDGSIIPLAYKSTWRHEDFYSARKSIYSVNTLAVCDDNRKIRYLATGWVGSANDMRVLPECGMGLYPDRYFSGDEYVMGDADYKQYKYLLVIKKTPKK